jgi:Bacterial cell division membrane protein
VKKSLFESSGDYLLFITIILLFIGSVNIFSASFVMADQQFGNSYHFVIRHLISVGAGTVAAAILYRLDYRRIVHLFPFWLPVVGLLLILVILFGIEVNGARRWLGPFFGFQVQPSEFAKIAVIMLGAWYSSFCYRRKRPPTFLHWSTGIALLFFGLIYLQPDFGTGLLMMSFFAVTLLLGGVSTKEIIAVGIVGVAGLGVIAVQAPYRLARLTNWWNPWEAQTAGGYQAVQSFLAIGSGGWLGMGGGQGISKFYYLPEAHTDFAFSVLAQEWGFAGVAVVLLLFLSLLLAGIRIAWKAVDAMGFCLAGGLTLFIVLQAFGNGMMVSGILPVTGIPMPFFSYGGTFMLTNLIAVGLLLSIWRVSEEASILREERAERHQEASESREEY